MAPSNGGFNPSQPLAFDDITVDSIDNPLFMRVRIKHSKTDPFLIGVNIIIGCTGGPLWPAAAYLAVRKGGEGPLFRFNALTCERFVTKVREVLQQVGIDQSKYSGHS